MADNQYLLSELQQLLSWKKSKKFYAEKLGITEDEVNELLKELRNGNESIRNEAETASYITELEDAFIKYVEDVNNGTGEIIMNSSEEIRSLEELIQKCKIDVNKWNVTKYVQNYWGNSKSPHWQVKAWLSVKSDEQAFQNDFISFLETYSPSAKIVNCPIYDTDKPIAGLVINKQDSHYDKYDIDGNNLIEERFNDVLFKMGIILNQADLSNHLIDIYYIIGSDEFNSEFTGTTTKGTPQQNILTHHQSFEAICDHEIDMINLLLEKSENVNVIYVPGNHDEYVGWHLIKWLEVYFRDNCRVSFDASPKYRKYISFGNTAMMLNHGDAMKPSKLASIFPIEYKADWSDHENFYIFTGDKHHELSQDFNGIKFYQIPAFSNAKSSWDSRNGYVGSRGEVTAFLIDWVDGMTNIFKQYL